MTVIVRPGSSLPPGGPDGPEDAPETAFDVRTIRSDATRATVHVSGVLDAGGARLLAEVIDGHIRAGRRFLRVHVGGLRQLGADGVAVLAAAHDRLLGGRGTLIVTGVGPHQEAALHAAGAAKQLLLVAPTAAERLD